MPVNRCPKCGEIFIEWYLFDVCPKCGASLEPEEAEDEE